jgi:hypothetical protein
MLQRPALLAAATLNLTGAVSFWTWPPDFSVPAMTPPAFSELPWA